MVTAIVVVSILLLLAIPITRGNRGMVFGRPGAKRARVPDDVPLPFLILPLAPDDPDERIPIQPMQSDRAMLQTPWSTSSRNGTGEHDASTAERDAGTQDEMNEVASDATVVFRRASDEPMQLLPGRLRVMAGGDGREEIRLFGMIGEPARVTIGRETGPAHRVLTLQSSTVSRRHAQLDFDEGVWVIRNLSRTNPIVVNDRILDDLNTVHRLVDGDRIELGEVVLQFVGR